MLSRAKAAAFLAAMMISIAPSSMSYAQPQGLPQIAFEKYVLPNSLQVILHEDHATPIVTVNLWYHVGSKNERAGRTGFAHLFEHLMFEGSEHYNHVYFRPLQQAGGRLNGSTASDRTNYWETVPSNFLELALWLESDRMGYLVPVLTQEKLDNQRAVVKNERRQSYENRPYGLVDETILAAMYPPEHPYAWPPIGSMKDIDAASREDVSDFFRQYYHPSNASLCIAGDFVPAEAKRLVARYFGPLPAGPEVRRPVVPLVTMASEKRIHMTDRVGLARLYLAWLTVPQFAPDDGTLDVLGHVLGGGKTSRLYRVLVREKQIAQDVEAYQDSEEGAGRFHITLTARGGHTLAELESAAAEEVRRIQETPPTAEELARAVNSFQSHLLQSLETVSGNGGRADQLNRYNTLTGDPGYLGKDFARWLAVQPEDVSAAARKYLGAGRVVVEVQPGSKLAIEPDPREAADAAREALARQLPAVKVARDDAPEDASRNVIPKPAAAAKFALPPIHRGRLSNGMDLLVVENHTLPVVHMHMVFPTGRAEDPPGHPGLASLTAAMWDEGTARRTSQDIALELAAIGASFSLDAGWDTTTARLFTQKRQLAKALDIFADVLAHPAFPPEELQRQRAMALGRLSLVRNEPTILASIAINQLLYGPDHPYGQPQYGTAASLKSFTREDLERFYHRHLLPQRATLVAVGDITLEELLAELEKTIGGWKAEPAAEVARFPALPKAEPTATLVVVDKPGAAQSVVALASIGAQRKSPEYFPLVVMNTALGGQFSSRLNMNLREEKGYTYGAHSAFDWRVHQAGPFIASASVQTAVTAPALAEFLKEFKAMLAGRPVGGKELTLSQQYITRGYAAGFETPALTASQLETLVTFDLPDNYFNTVIPSVDAVTADEVARVAKEHLPLDRFSIVVVGDWAKIGPGLKELHLDRKLVVYHFDDNFRLLPTEK